MIKSIIIDDEPLAIEVIENLASQIPFLEVIGRFQNPVDAIFFLQNNNVDLVFCDIEMPEINGIEVIKNLEKPPLFIIITAFRDFAIDSFELGVFDYLVKPVSFERFLKAIDKVKRRMGLETIIHPTEYKSNPDAFVYLKVDKSMLKVFVNEILYIETNK